jgi:ketosteroid isomerase-like protein
LVVTIEPEAAHAVIEAAHEAWNNGNVEGMLAAYVDDLTYVSNTGPDGQSLVINGKADFRARFEPIMSIVEAKTFIEDFRFLGTTARIRFSTYVRHRETGHELTGTYREVCTFRGLKICKIEDFHDAARMAAFWQLVGG